MCKKFQSESEKLIINKVKTELDESYRQTRKNEEIRKKKTKVLIIIAVFCSICLIGMFLANFYILNNLPTDVQIADDTYKNTLLSDGLAIIAIAVSVWAGLNIANAIERKELDEANRKIKDTNEKINETNEEFNTKITPILDSARSIQSSLGFMFFNTLLQTIDDEASKYLYQSFLLLDDEQNRRCEAYYPNMIIIEQIFVQLLKTHKSKQLKIIELESMAEEGIEIINYIIGENYEKEDSIKVDLLVTYFKYRKAEFCYYLGYITSDHQKYYNFFIKAIEIYLQVYLDFHAFVPKYSPVWIIPNYSGDSKYRDISMYFMNSIGDAYSRFILYAKPEWKIKDKSGKELENADFIEMGKKAVFYCSCSAKWTKPSENHEVYYRNLGCAYERLERHEGEFGKYYEKIIENYSKALESIANDDTHSYRIQSVYHTLVQYIKKYLDISLKINEVFKNSDFSKKDSIIEVVELDDEKSELLKKLYYITEFAKTDNRRKTLQYSVNGLTLTIIILYKINNDPNINMVCDLTIEDCMKAIEDDILFLKMMGQHDLYSEELYRRYALIINSNYSKDL